MPAGEVELSQSESICFNGLGVTKYPMDDTAENKVKWLLFALPSGSSLKRQAEALRGLELESRDTVSRITDLYGRDSFCRDIYACMERIGNSRPSLKWLTFFTSVLEPEGFDAISINEQLKKKSLGPAMLLICSRTASEIKKIKEKYRALFNVQLEVNIRNFTDGYLTELLLKCISTPPARHEDDDEDMLDRGQLEEIVISLHEEITKIAKSLQTIINVVGKSREYIGAVSDAYETKYGTSLERDLKSAQDGLCIDGLLAIISGDRAKYFAELLHTARIQNDRETIVWVIATMAKRPEMEGIKAEYSNRYGITLEGHVYELFDCTDNYELICGLLNYSVPN